MGQFEAKTYDEDDRVRVTLAGECDLAVREEVHATLHAAVRAAPKVVVDLSELVFLDSSGVHNLVAAHHAALERGGRLVVVNATGSVATVLELTGVATLLSPRPPAGHAPGEAAGERGAGG